LDGFGEKSEATILETLNSLKKHKSGKERMLLNHAESIAGRVIAYLKELDCVQDAQALGSLRRRESTVGDLDIAVATIDGDRVIEHFVKFPEVEDVTAKGGTRAAVVLRNDV